MMVIDLTQDSDSEDQFPQKPSFFSHLTHRTQSLLKRKSKRSSEAPSLTPVLQSYQPRTVVNGVLDHFLPNNASSSNNSSHSTNHDDNIFSPNLPNPSTPSPSPDAQRGVVSVVIPSPSRQLKREIASSGWIVPQTSHPELTALSKQHYPVDAHEKRALRGAYPAAKKVKRADIPLAIGAPGPVLAERIPVHHQLQQTIRRKLSVIKGPKVTFAPEEDKLLAEFASNFEFINKYKLRKGVSHIPEEFIGGCDCGDACDFQRCTCLEEDENSPQKIIPYRAAKDHSGLLVLTPDFLKRTSIITECSSYCSCNDQCWNRVVQKGRTVKLEIFHTGNRGFGLRSPDRIRAGQFIDCYLGEVITKKQADVREEIATSTHGHSYLFGLDFFHNDDEIFVVDGQKFGSPTRFMNHSCNPNCKMFPVSRTYGDERLYDLAFFALREIPPMTELTFDYNPNCDKGKGKKVDPNAVRCLCNEKNCRGQLWPNQRKGTK